MGTAVHQLDRVVTGKDLKHLHIAVDADRSQARWLALHQRPAPRWLSMWTPRGGISAISA